MTAVKTTAAAPARAAEARRIDERSLILFYVGAFLGPFGTTIASVLLTTLAETFRADLGVVTLSITAYMIPFALSLLFSGAISDAIGSRRAVTGGCLLFGAASLVCAVAPTIEVFLAGRALQGVGNAFTTALLMASMGDLMPPHRLGKAIGFFAAFQMAGGLFGPMASGFLALANWRLSFLLVVVVAIGLARYYWQYYARLGIGLTGRGGTNPIRAIAGLWNGRMALLCAASFLGYIGAPSIGYLVAIDLERRYGASPALAGIVLAGFGLINVLAAPKAGGWVDTVGRWRTVGLAAIATALLMAAIAAVPWLIPFAILFALLGLPTVVTWTSIGTLAIEAFPEKRGAATSIFNAAKFAGFAASPAVFTPLYTAAGPGAAYLVAGLVTASLAIPISLYLRLNRSPGD